MYNATPQVECYFSCDKDISSQCLYLKLTAKVGEFALKEYLEARFGYNNVNFPVPYDPEWGFGYMTLKALVDAEKDRINLECPPDYKVISETHRSQLAQLRGRAEKIAGFKLDRNEDDYGALHGYLNYLESRLNKLEGRETAPEGG